MTLLQKKKTGKTHKYNYDISVIVPVVERHDDLEGLYISYADEIKKLTDRFEFIFVVDGHKDKAYLEIKRFAGDEPKIKVIKFQKTFGESIAISVGLERAQGRYVFTLAAYMQVEPYEIKKLYDALCNDECDVAIAKRLRRNDTPFNRMQSAVFHRILKLFTGAEFGDISCGLKGLKKEIVEQFDIYGDQHRFIPILAEHKGLRVKEIEVEQHTGDTKTRVYKLRTYLNRVIDIIALFFLIRFTYKPLRFFGLVGSFFIIAGMAINGYLIFLRLFTSNFGLTDKPSLFLSSLLIVIGIQIFAVGLIGEIIIYTHSKRAKSYNIKEIRE